MLSISKAIKGGGQGEYYLNLASSDDYYLDAEEPPGFWLGQGARALGLEGTIDQDQFRNLFQGLSPDGKTELVRNAGSPDRRSGWDLTWSVPKSVSTVWSQASPVVRQQIEAAVNQAAGEGTRYLESIGVVTRRGEDGVIRENASLIFAAFPHSTSRAQDPQLHVHTLLLNVCVRPNGSTGTIDPRELFRHQHTADAMFRVELAAQLEKRLGLRAVPDGRAFELFGVDRELMATFSKRRREIESVMSQRGLSGSKAAEAVAFETRARKVARPREELFADWQQIGRDHQWSTRELSLLLGTSFRPRDLTVERRVTSDNALERLTLHESHFAIRDLTRAIAEEAQGRGLDAADVRQLRDALLRSRRLIPLGEHRREARFTTEEVLQAEKQLLQTAASLRQAEAPVSDLPWLTDLVFEQHPTLSSEQRIAIESVTASRGGIQLVSGMAGTGKSFAFGVAREVWELQGMTVTGACLSGKAASGLQDGSGIPSQTLHRLLGEIQRGERVLDHRSVVLIDEAAMVGTRQLRDVAVACSKAGAKLVLAGDAGQLQSIEAGGGFATLSRSLGTSDLTQILRQREAWAREAVKDFAFGRAEVALAAYDARGLLTVRAEPESAEGRLLADWCRSGRDDPRGRVILAGTQSEVARLNALAQQARLDTGRLSGEPVQVGEERFFLNDRILFLRNNATLGVFNGELGTLVKREGTVLTVAMDHPREVCVDTADYPHLRLGYALTTHRAQGLTTEEVFVLTGTLQSRELTYVQASRARGATRIYISGEPVEEAAHRMNHSRPKEMAHDVAKSNGLTHELLQTQ
ncbi:MAG: MobF family relaxase [Limisphaerales bacterium]